MRTLAPIRSATSASMLKAVAVMSLAVMSLAGATGAAAASGLVGHQTTVDPAVTTTLVIVDGPDAAEGGGVIPRPNSGAGPQASGDRGGWAQLLLWAIMSAGLVGIMARIAWGIRTHSRANQSA